MCVLKKGFNVRFKFSIITIMATAVLLTAGFASDATAQQSKPALVRITLDETTNDSKAVEIAKRLNPDLFSYEKETKKQYPEADFIAAFFPLNKNNVNKFLILTTINNPDYCTGYGCPFYIYTNNKNNEWSLSLSTQAFSLLYDKNSRDKKPANIISQHNPNTDKPLNVWMWNGQYYQKVDKQ